MGACGLPPCTCCVWAAERPADELLPQLIISLAAHKVNGARDVSQLVDDEVQGTQRVAHAAQEEDLRVGGHAESGRGGR